MWTIGLLIREAEKLGVILTEAEANSLSLYASKLIDYNEHTNLVGNAHPDRLLYDHILDSLSLIPLINRFATNDRKGKLNLIDIGTGAGFPGLVLAITRSDLFLTAVDATAKKIVFIESIIQTLQMQGRVKVVHARAEEIGHQKNFRSMFNLVTCRAVGALPLVCEITLPFLKVGGYAFLQRGGKYINEDIEQLAGISKLLGFEFIDCVMVNPEVIGKDHRILVLKQAKPMAAKYPRAWKEIKS